MPPEVMERVGRAEQRTPLGAQLDMKCRAGRETLEQREAELVGSPAPDLVLEDEWVCRLPVHVLQVGRLAAHEDLDPRNSAPTRGQHTRLQRGGATQTDNGCFARGPVERIRREEQATKALGLRDRHDRFAVENGEGEASVRIGRDLAAGLFGAAGSHPADVRTRNGFFVPRIDVAGDAGGGSERATVEVSRSGVRILAAWGWIETVSSASPATSAGGWTPTGRALVRAGHPEHFDQLRLRGGVQLDQVGDEVVQLVAVGGVNRVLAAEGPGSQARDVRQAQPQADGQ